MATNTENVLCGSKRIGRELTEAWKAGERVCATVSAQGGSRSGKTYNIVLWLAQFLMTHKKPVVLSVCRATLPALKGSVFRDFRDVMQKAGWWREDAWHAQEMIYEFPNGSFAEFFSVSDEQKLRGRTRDLLFVNEANELTEHEFQQLQMRTKRLTILDYNPSFSDDHWICGVNKNPKTRHFKTTYKDNPFLSKYPRIISEIESLKEKNPTLWQVYGLGQQAQVEGLVFPSFDIVETLPDVRRRYIGVDYGFTHDPTAIVEVRLDDATKTAYLREVCYQTEMLTTDIIRVLKAQGNVEVVSESADPRLVQEIYNAGVNIKPVKKGAGSIEAGIAVMQTWSLKVERSSSNLIKELRNYTYQRDKEGKWLNVPIDAFNHALDATRYVLISKVLGANRPVRSRAIITSAYEARY